MLNRYFASAFKPDRDVIRTEKKNYYIIHFVILEKWKCTKKSGTF